MSLLKQQQALMSEPAGLDKRQGGLAGRVARAARAGRMAMLAGLLLVVTLLAMPGAAQAQQCGVDSIIENGGFNQPTAYTDPYTIAARIFTPAPWTNIVTPDLSVDGTVSFDVFFEPFTDLPIFDVSGNPIPNEFFNSSPDGGSFMGFRRVEGVRQDVDISDPNLRAPE